MGSKSDLPIMQEAIDILVEFNIDYQADVVSAHRTPEKMMDYAKNAHLNGVSVIIAGAGGAAHLPGMVASISPLPVIGVPIKSISPSKGFNNPESRWRKVVLPTPDAPNINRFSFDVFISGKLNSESSSYLNLKFFVSNILSKLRFIMI